MSKRIAYQMPMWKDGPELVYSMENGKPNPIGVQVSKDDETGLHEPYSGQLLMATTATAFAQQLGYKVEKAPKRPRIPRYGKILDTLREMGVEVPEKKGKPKKAKKQPRKPRPRFSKEYCPEFDQLQALQEKYPYTGRNRPRPDGTGYIFSMADKNGRPALAVYAGEGKFRPANTRDIRDMEKGTRTIARNKWAARVLTEKWAE